MLLPLARMNSSAFSFLSDFVLVLLLFIHVPSSSSNDDLFTACGKKFECGGVSAGFPFWGNDRSPACGVPELELRCEDNIARMNISQVAYRVLEINQADRILRIAREDSFAGLCPPQFMNSTFNPKVFESDIEGYKNLTILYGCKDAATIPAGTIPFTCKINEVNDQRGYIQVGDTGPGECNRSVLVPVSITDWPPIWNLQALEELLKKGFKVRLKVDKEACWECITTSGACGIDYATNQTTCYCPNQSSGSKTCALPAPGARGTIGYIAPEVFCRSFGGVTYKSDVYSYGMMVLDMVGQSKDFDMGSLETNEMYFLDWFYMYLEPGKISTLHGGITKEEEEIVEKMILVGLWCIQTIPSHRPSMTKVVEMFEGSLQSLQIPPRPSFSSPRRSAQEHSSTVSSLPCVSSQGDEVNKLPADESDL